MNRRWRGCLDLARFYLRCHKADRRYGYMKELIIWIINGRWRVHKFFSILFHSLAIAIIVFGSLINFHQYKIWGKPLIPQFIGLKNDGDKAGKILASGNFTLKNSFTQKLSFHSPVILPMEITRHSSGLACIPTFDLCDKVPALQHLNAYGLRAPPLS